MKIDFDQFSDIDEARSAILAMLPIGTSRADVVSALKDSELPIWMDKDDDIEVYLQRPMFEMSWGVGFVFDAGNKLTHVSLAQRVLVP